MRLGHEAQSLNLIIQPGYLLNPIIEGDFPKEITTQDGTGGLLAPMASRKARQVRKG
jgi:hypothetical protein